MADIIIADSDDSRLWLFKTALFNDACISGLTVRAAAVT
jgi:hypothetical protein